MTPDEFREFLSLTPTLYHMAEHKSSELIQNYGLRSTSGLLDLFGYEGDIRSEIESQRRSDSIVIAHPQIGRAVVRDQKPMTDDGLKKCLQDGLSPQDWYFFFKPACFFLAHRRSTSTHVVRPALQK